MDAPQLESLLKELNACPESIEWCKGKNLKQAFKECLRADWILWLLVSMADKPNWPKAQLVGDILCECVNLSLLIWEKYRPNDNRPRQLLILAKRFYSGKASIDELNNICDFVRDAIWKIKIDTIENINLVASGTAIWAAARCVIWLNSEKDCKIAASASCWAAIWSAIWAISGEAANIAADDISWSRAWENAKYHIWDALEIKKVWNDNKNWDAAWNSAWKFAKDSVGAEMREFMEKKTHKQMREIIYLKIREVE